MRSHHPQPTFPPEIPPGRPTGFSSLIDTGTSRKAAVDSHFMPNCRGLGAYTVPLPPVATS